MTFLNEVRAGSRVRLDSISAGDALRMRMAQLGLFEGEGVIVEKNDSGPIVLGLSGGRVAIGRGQAMRILVTII